MSFVNHRLALGLVAQALIPGLNGLSRRTPPWGASHRPGKRKGGKGKRKIQHPLGGEWKRERNKRRRQAIKKARQNQS